jgi:hypothetical protein
MGPGPHSQGRGGSSGQTRLNVAPLDAPGALREIVYAGIILAVAAIQVPRNGRSVKATHGVHRR